MLRAAALMREEKEVAEGGGGDESEEDGEGGEMVDLDIDCEEGRARKAHKLKAATNAARGNVNARGSVNKENFESDEEMVDLDDDDEDDDDQQEEEGPSVPMTEARLRLLAKVSQITCHVNPRTPSQPL